MRGWDTVTVFGDVVNFDFGKTDTYQSEACTINLAVKKRGGHLINARVNIYGDKVHDCRRNLAAGDSVVVRGELMTRRCVKTNDKVLEIRGLEIEFMGRAINE